LVASFSVSYCPSAPGNASFLPSLIIPQFNLQKLDHLDLADYYVWIVIQPMFFYEIMILIINVHSGD